MHAMMSFQWHEQAGRFLRVVSLWGGWLSECRVYE